MWHLNVPVQWSFDRYTSILYHTEFHRARFSMHIYIYIFSCSRYGLQMTVWDIHPAWYRERGKSYGDRMGYPGNPSEALLVVLSPTYSTISVILWNIIEYHIHTVILFLPSNTIFGNHKLFLKKLYRRLSDCHLSVLGMTHAPSGKPPSSQ